MDIDPWPYRHISRLGCSQSSPPHALRSSWWARETRVEARVFFSRDAPQRPKKSPPCGFKLHIYVFFSLAGRPHMLLLCFFLEILFFSSWMFKKSLANQLCVCLSWTCEPMAWGSASHRNRRHLPRPLLSPEWLTSGVACICFGLQVRGCLMLGAVSAAEF